LLLAGSVIGLKFGSSFYFAGCEGDIAGNLSTPVIIDGEPKSAYANTRCTIYSTNTACSVSYKSIAIEDMNLSVCLWSDRSVNIAGKSIQCFMNGELSCEDFSQITTQRCQDVPDCRPVSSIKAAVERLKPQ